MIKLSTQDKCGGCVNPFSGRSSINVCLICNHKFHKSCLGQSDHLCNGAGPSRPNRNSCTNSPEESITNEYTIPAVDNPTLNINLLESQDTTIEPTLSSIHPHNHNHTLSRPNISEMHTPASIASLPLPRGLNPLAAPFELININKDEVPRDTGNTKNTGKGSKNTKTKVANDGDRFSLELSRVEVNTLKAKIKEQECSIKDLKFQNSVLLERVGDLEKTQKQAVFEATFPTSNKSCAVSCRPCCNHRIQDCQSYRCCNTVQAHPSTSPDIVERLDSLDTKVNNLVVLLSTSSATNEQRTDYHPSPIKAASSAISPTPDTPEKSSDSLASIEEFMPPDASNHLNYKALTNRC